MAAVALLLSVSYTNACDVEVENFSKPRIWHVAIKIYTTFKM